MGILYSEEDASPWPYSTRSSSSVHVEYQMKEDTIDVNAKH